MGYKELSLVLSGEISLDSAIEKIKNAHRRLIRRQGNWFKEGDTRINWVTLDSQGIKSVWERIDDFRAQP